MSAIVILSRLPGARGAEAERLRQLFGLPARWRRREALRLALRECVQRRDGDEVALRALGFDSIVAASLEARKPFWQP